MTKNEIYFAVIPIHGRNAIVQGENVQQLKSGIDETLKKPEEVYPFHDFREEITVIKGRKVKIPEI